MNAINEIIDKKIKNNELVIIELGPGEIKKDNRAIGIDICEKSSVDYRTDLTKGLIFLENNSVDIIHAYHFLEHLEDLEFFMSEIFRVLKKNGRLIGTVPHFSNPYFYSDYTHKSLWGLYTLSYFTKNNLFKRTVPKYYNSIEFYQADIQIIFASPFRFRNIIKKIFQKFFNLNRYMQELYEEIFVYLFPCYEIYFELEKR
ncbi:MAG: Unknown protein [uncultured Sulfurovum sp.]|uniref:Methyltransferase type 11 domain-containing protein n=1 Tax=uncultured Sulfurovum sp. TaxID=269237 RepID=A0A6S6T411_9BACT|nr:MAG: Unknown protein [uncultured Sulfurovum sp.]